MSSNLLELRLAQSSCNQMDQANERRKLNGSRDSDTVHADAISTPHSESLLRGSQEDNIHSGEEIQNSNGHVHIGGDFTPNTYNLPMHPAAHNQFSSGRNTTISNEEHKRILISSLKFTQMDAHRNSIRGARMMYKWFLKTPEYLDWLDSDKFGEHGGLLWVKGKPGTGKSTLMMSTFWHVQFRKLRKDRVIAISFFFNAKGNDLGRSTAGLYRSLLVQLFEARQGVQVIILDDNWPSSEWSLESLQNLFKAAILAMGKALIICFIDALDECDQREIGDMLSFLQNTSEQAASNGTRLHMCFASRHCPHITIERGLTLILEERLEHDREITKYLENELQIGHGRYAEKIRSSLQEKNSGVIMWVVLVVRMLNMEYDRGCVHMFPNILDQIRSDLQALSEHLDSR
ncbi:hypothetical protein F4820DRAFT_7981 [Hypoxylon rubiginosum]|uniref:Uncharacterized protein n=1 Tax=Hypoxylon rubiginosum TaxID=110542 RepID=A0ACB9ZI85_9PEZI|nr:hypothetical protein F4820DRAFT_7981 [Hypoxylon rubiginosum]